MYIKNKTMANSSGQSAGISTGGLLLVAFIVLKLCGVINWSWWWVLSPMWIPLVIMAIILLVWLAIRLIGKL